MKRKLIISLIGFISFNINAQQSIYNSNKKPVNHEIPGIKIGDKVPDVALPKIVHVDGSTESGKLSDYYDRLLILDFMYTRCGACIAGLPKKNQLQQEFGDKIKILVVVGGEAEVPGMLQRENEKVIRAYLTQKNTDDYSRNNGFLLRRNVKIPWVVENKTLNDFFPHKRVSHVVWIYKGKFVAETEQDYVSKENIQFILDGKKNNFPVKNDFLPPVDLKTPLILQNKSKFTGERSLHYSAIFGSYQDAIETKIGIDRDSINRTRRDYIINLPLINIYTVKWGIATGISRFMSPSHTILEVNDPTQYVVQEDSKEYSYVVRNRTRICYESVRPDTGQTEKQAAMSIIADLDNLLGLYGRYEKRKIKCLSLVPTGSENKLKSAGSDKNGFVDIEQNSININNRSLDVLVWKLNEFYGNPPTFNETGYREPVDLNLVFNSWTDIPSIRKALLNYGLDLKEEERELEVFVLTEKN